MWFIRSGEFKAMMILICFLLSWASVSRSEFKQLTGLFFGVTCLTWEFKEHINLVVVKTSYSECTTTLDARAEEYVNLNKESPLILTLTMYRPKGWQRCISLPLRFISESRLFRRVIVWRDKQGGLTKNMIAALWVDYIRFNSCLSIQISS